MGFRLTFDHNHCGNVFCGLCGVGEAFCCGNKGAHMWHGEREKGKG